VSRTMGLSQRQLHPHVVHGVAPVNTNASVPRMHLVDTRLIEWLCHQVCRQGRGVCVRERERERERERLEGSLGVDELHTAAQKLSCNSSFLNPHVEVGSGLVSCSLTTCSILCFAPAIPPSCAIPLPSRYAAVGCDDSCD
jgi:hypothetical protein